MGSRERERGVKKTSGEQLNINIIITGWGGGRVIHTNMWKHDSNCYISFIKIIHHHHFCKPHFPQKGIERQEGALCFFLLQFKKMAINWFSSDLVNFLSDDLIHSYINRDTLLVIVFLVFVDRIKQNKHKQNGHVKQCKYDNNNYIRLELINRK
jgi:hypothetical protein